MAARARGQYGRCGRRLPLPRGRRVPLPGRPLRSTAACSRGSASGRSRRWQPPHSARTVARPGRACAVRRLPERAGFDRSARLELLLEVHAPPCAARRPHRRNRRARVRLRIAAIIRGNVPSAGCGRPRTRGRDSVRQPGGFAFDDPRQCLATGRGLRRPRYCLDETVLRCPRPLPRRCAHDARRSSGKTRNDARSRALTRASAFASSPQASAEVSRPVCRQ